MDRRLINSGAMVGAIDAASAQQFSMIAIGMLAEAVAGPGGWAYGLACTPTAPASMTLNVGRGCLGQMTVVDQSNPGTPAIADNTDPLQKIGINLQSTQLTFNAPSAAGNSQCFLIQGQMAEQDGGATVLPYYNSTNPSQPFSGPNNSGAAVNTVRTQRVALQSKAGAPAATGSQAAPAADNGWLPLWVVTIPNGATSLTGANIAVAAGAPFIPNLANINLRINPVPFLQSGTYVPSANLLVAEAFVVGPGGSGGGAVGGSNTAAAGGGGGGGGLAHGYLTPAQIGGGQQVTVGFIGGVNQASSIGGYLIGNQGANGAAGNPQSQPAVTPPGVGGAYSGSAALPFGSRQGQSGEPGLIINPSLTGIGGRGGSSPFGFGGAPGTATDVSVGHAANGQDYGAGGAGAGALASTIAGGAGAPGFVYILEYIQA